MSTNRIRVLLVSLLAVFAVSAVASASASAATTCYKVAEPKTGAYEKVSATTGKCEGPVTKGEYVEVEKLETNLGAGVWCAKVKAGEPSTYEDNKCEHAKVGTGEYTRVLVECTKEAEAKVPEYCIVGTLDQDHPLTNEHVTSKGGTFILENTPSIECAAETDTAEISQVDGGPGTDKNVKITFTGCKVKGVSTAKCTVTDSVTEVAGTIAVPATTSELKTAGGIIYDVFGAAKGTFVTIEIDKVGGETCLFESPGLEVKGQSCGESSQVLAKEALLTFSKAIEKTCDEAKLAEPLTLGGKTANLNGISKQELLGTFEAANKGAEWAEVLS